MNKIIELLSTPGSQALALTLLHSLWQGFVIFLIVVLLLKSIPGKFSNLRYCVAAGGLLLLVITTTATLNYLVSSNESSQSITLTFNNNYPQAVNANPAQDKFNFYYVLNRAIPFIVTGWIIGTIIFAFRLIAGFVYVQKIRKESQLIVDVWSDRFHQLASQLNIKSAIALAQSSHVTSPAVIGFIKPMVLVPVGVFSGLSTQQIEAVFLHELCHIKRHDYLVNIIQCCVEVLMFFNPFMWMITNIIRIEREKCCDDLVLRSNINPKAYAYALKVLEEQRLFQPGLALSLSAKSQYQLLHRIKRIMEKESSNYPTGRIAPAILLIIGLICASWITINNSRKNESTAPLSAEIEADTTKPKTRSYYKMHITRTGPDGKPHTEVIERFDDGSDNDSQTNIDTEFDMPAATGFDFMPEFSFDNFGTMFKSDSLPGLKGFEEWQGFMQDFEPGFQEHFKHMDEVLKNLDGNFDSTWMIHMEEQVKRAQQLAEEHAKFFNNKAYMFKDHEEQLKEMEEHLEKLNNQDFNFNIDSVTENFSGFEDKMEKFKVELKEQLINDGLSTRRRKINPLLLGP